MASEIPRQILSDAFHSRVSGRQLRAAVFLTFEFDPGFFELDVLPSFFDVSLSHVPEIRLLGLADELRKVDAIAVYYDRQALIAGSTSSHLDIQRVAVSQRTGYFHPKVVLALYDDALIVGVLSANLTRSGWWENVEVAHLEEMHEGEACSFRRDLLDMIARLRRATAHVVSHPALDQIHRFVRNSLVDDEQRMRNSLVLPRLFFGDTNLVEWLQGLAGNRLQRCNLEIFSPFFDDSESLDPMHALQQTFRPRETRVFLPRRDGAALCSAAYYERTSDLAGWGTLPSDVMRLAKDLDRSLHAKVYRFFDPTRRYEAYFVGSANLTSAALKRGGNIESGFFVEVEPKRKPDWWLTTITTPPAIFQSRSEEETLAKGRGWRLSVRYDWRRATAECFWDGTEPSPAIELLAQGAHLFHLLPLTPGMWHSIHSEQSAAIATALTSSSFLTVRIPGEPDAVILVEEEGMTHKPSLMARVNANDILRYWALLTPEQKKEFLEEHAGAFDDPEIAAWLGTFRRPQDDTSFFSTFAQIYLSFGNLERAVRQALDEGRTKEAVERIFGRKFDSLRRLIERVGEEAGSDPVRRYIIVLCARQILTRLETTDSDLLTAYKTDLQELQASLTALESIREAFAFPSAADRDHFFKWFDEWFLHRAEPMEVQQ